MPTLSTEKPVRKSPAKTDGAAVRASIADLVLELRAQVKACPRRALRKKDRELLAEALELTRDNLRAK